MMRLTLAIAGKTLFDLDVESQAGEVRDALNAVMESFWLTMLPFADVLERLPVPQMTARESGARQARRHHLQHDRGASSSRQSIGVGSQS